MSTRLKDFFGQHEITHWDAGQLLKEAGALLQGLPNAAIRNAKEAVEEGDALVDSAKRAVQEALSFMDELAAGEQKLCARYDHLYVTVTKKRREIAEKLKELPPLPDLHVPYDVDKVIDAAERLSNMDDRALRVLESIADAARRAKRDEVAP